MSSPNQIPPGWYPVPALPGQERWWDGHAWTSRWRVVRSPHNRCALGFGSPAAFLPIGIVAAAFTVGFLITMIVLILGGSTLGAVFYGVAALLLAVMAAVCITNAIYGFRLRRERRALG
ncbi:DUF2510 domain-containing protein [Microbacterium sediminis]|uniref:DUF2510 domain-containing protein n=1 Tax=Microbacterium sediminis TaxID=904291 RepID=A0A1B9N9M0_9MICO|nr:DUF2510 domain-containing protein [Microbacterium sediminis]OCG73311.1 hypothetical protein A7J15_08430 [Microbacterium sediminis]